MDHIEQDNLNEIRRLVDENENLRERVRSLLLEPVNRSRNDDIYHILNEIRRNKDQIEAIDLDIQHGEVFGVPHPG